MMRSTILLTLVSLGLSAQASFGQERLEPVYSIWDVNLGKPVSQMPDAKVGEIACGTNGGPSGQVLASFTDFMNCVPEASGLREVEFNYDDEQDYIAKALEVEYKFLQGGTSVYAHPVIVSLLVDPEGIVQGRRIATDNRAADTVRRTAFTLISNFKARYSDWSLNCADIPMQEGEQPVGTQFVHELCTGQSPDGGTRISVEASYLRKKGQEAINRETQQVNSGYFESQTRYEEVLAPYTPVVAP
ncbi:MAG: hypothetical protein H6873_03625 [Hyphomicrobiaceae bacterium]|nr:hypothetical protein [Hyphomicrobiaceae bacterium]